MCGMSWFFKRFLNWCFSRSPNAVSIAILAFPMSCELRIGMSPFSSAITKKKLAFGNSQRHMLQAAASPTTARPPSNLTAAMLRCTGKTDVWLVFQRTPLSDFWSPGLSPFNRNTRAGLSEVDCLPGAARRPAQGGPEIQDHL